MDKKTQLKVVVCGVALVSLSAIHATPASGQVLASGGGCDSFISGAATTSGACVQFDPGPQTWRVDFFGNHSFKVIVDVLQTFYLEIEPDIFLPPGPLSLTSRYPSPSTETCIPYVFATSNTPTVGDSCALYNVRAFDSDGNEISQEDAGQYFNGQVLYRIAWDFPTLASSFDNPRGLRAEDGLSPFFDLTTGVHPTLVSGEDPGVDMQADGFSQYIVVHQTHLNTFAGCAAPLNCSSPTNPNANIFNAPQTIPIKVFLNPQNPSADLRLTYNDSDGVPHVAEAAGNSNIENKFRRTGSSMTFNWKTAGLEPGVYQLTISAGTDSGDLFAPQTFLITIQ